MTQFKKKYLYALLLLGLGLQSCEERVENVQVETREIVSEALNTKRLSNFIVYSVDGLMSDRSLSIQRTDIPTNAIEITKDSYQSYKVTEGQSYYLPEGEIYSGDIKFAKNVNYYIQGEMTVTNAWGTDANLYVLPSGKLNYTLSNLDNNNTITNEGELVFTNRFSIGTTGEVTSISPITFTNDLYVDGGELITYSNTEFTHLEVNAASYVELGSCAYAKTSKINGGTVYVKSYLTLESTLELTRYAHLTLGEGSILNSENIIVHNITSTIENEGSSYAVIDAETITLHQQWTFTSFRGNLSIHGYIDNQSGTELYWLCSILFNKDIYIPEDGCKPSFGTAPVVEEPVYYLNPIAYLEPAENDLSATAIAFDGENTYVSWHKRGDEYRGWIDILCAQSNSKSNEDTLYIKSSYSASDIDFNYILSDESNIYVAGDNKNGALVGFIDYNGQINLETLNVAGTSANSILKRDENIILASSGETGVVATIDLEERSLVSEHSAPYAKSVFMCNNELNVLYNISGDISKVDNLDNESKNYTVGAITPVYGKNACISDDQGKQYIPMGAGGLKIFDNGTEISHFSLNDNNSVNCVDVDDNYIYVAYGTLGLYILDKATLEVLTNYQFGDASANFVKKKDDGNIYVAYGTSGIHVVQLMEQ